MEGAAALYSMARLAKSVEIERVLLSDDNVVAGIELNDDGRPIVPA